METTLEKIVVMADQHIPHLSERMERITLQYVKDNARNISNIVFLGDGVDNPAMSEFPPRPQDRTLLQEELDQYTRHMSKYSDAAKKANIHVLQGNHDFSRLERTKSLNRSMASLRALEFSKLLRESVDEQKLKLTYSFHETLKLKGINFTHGDRRIDPYLKDGKHGVKNTAHEYPHQGDVVMGHKHIVAQEPRPLGDSSVYVVGAMFDIDAIAKQYKAFHGYQNGFMVITVNGKELQFQNIAVGKQPLFIDGKRYN
jgi:predicted phosphodiesterase